MSVMSILIASLPASVLKVITRFSPITETDVTIPSFMKAVASIVESVLPLAFFKYIALSVEEYSPLATVVETVSPRLPSSA